MKNLKLVISEFILENDLIHAKAMCINSDTHAAYIMDCYNMYDVDVPLQKVQRRANLDLGINTNENIQVVAMDFLFGMQSICFALSSGDVFTFDLHTNQTECVGSVSSSIHHASWSPDQEILALTTGESTLILMTKEFDPIVEKDLQTSDFGEGKPMNVGWGSKETQFHGSEGKEAAKVKEIKAKPAMPWDDKIHRISWRGDGDLFVTSIIDKSLGCRRLRIWSRGGILQYTSEIKDGLEHPLCWRPSGNLITCTLHQPHKHEVVFFERNGLQHGEFTLPHIPNLSVVKELLWNSDSSLLAIWGHTLNDSELPNYHITVWSMSNYHWYLKQHLSFGNDEDSSVKCVLWDKVFPYMLHVLCSGGKYMRYEWRWSHDQSVGNSEENDVSTAVIDNASVLITPFRKMIMPPPMCPYSVNFPAAVTNVVFAPSPLKDFAAILSCGRIALVCKTHDERRSISTECKFTFSETFGNIEQPYAGFYLYNVEWDKESANEGWPLLLKHWTWLADNHLVCIGNTKNMPTPMSPILSLNLSECSETNTLKGRCLIRTEGVVTDICSPEDGKFVLLLLQNKSVAKFENGRISYTWEANPGIISLPSPLLAFCPCEVNGKVYVLGLDDKYKLYCSGKVLVSNCTSFACHDEFLLVTTQDSLLLCYQKTSLDKLFSGDLSGSLECSSQSIESGAKIVAAVPKDTKLILQLPRGNLEVIHPRPLMVSAIGKYLDNLEFMNAFSLAKKHRIHMNILYDHNPKKFLDNVETFVDQIQSPENINLFLANLCEDDVCQTLYSFGHATKCKKNDPASPKADNICESIRSVLESKKDMERYFTTLMATYAQKSEPELDKALSKIKERRAYEKMVDNEKTTASNGLKYLLYLVNVSELYKVALSTYDLEIAVMVAEKSQMDPMDYLPFLNDLRKLEDNYQKYKIDIHLNRYKKALENICKCEDRFEECLSLIKNQKLYTSALYLFPMASDKSEVIWSAYGDYLTGKMYHNEAAIVYSKSGNHAKALKAYQEARDWHNASCEARKLGYSDTDIAVLAKNMAGNLKEIKRYEESALLMEHYVRDIEESIVTLIDGQLWDSAFSLMTKYNRLDIVPTHFLPALVEQCNYLDGFLDEQSDLFNKHTLRLKIVRKEKHESDQKDDVPGDCHDDLFSDTSSMSGVTADTNTSSRVSGSLITRKSSRGRKKQELKKYRLKEGSANEDLALMTELSEIVTKIDQSKDNFCCFLSMLVKLDLPEEARTLQQKMKEIVNTIETEFPNIWITENKNFVPETFFGPDCSVNTITAAMQVHQKLLQLVTDPELKPPVWRKNLNMFLNLLVN